MTFNSALGRTIYPIKKISEGCNFLSGYAFKGTDFTSSGIPIIKIKNIQNGKVTLEDSTYVSESVINGKLERFQLQAGDILIAMTGQGSVGRVGKLYISNNTAPYLNQRVGKFIPDEKNLNKDFLYYVISTRVYEQLLFAAGSGSGQPNLSPATIMSVEIPYPPYQIQCGISKILRDIDDKIHLNTQTNQTLESIAQAIFKSWFVDFEPVKAKMTALAEGGTREQAELAAMGAISSKSEAELAQLQQQNPEHYQQLAETAALFPSAMVESELGEIPEGWEVKLSGEIMDIRDGTHDSPKQSEIGFPLITSKHIVSGTLAINDAYLISADDFEKINKRSKVSTGDILLTMIGTVGTPYLVMQKNTDFAIKNIGLFKTSCAKTLRNYFFILLKSGGMQGYLEARMIGTTQKYLSLKALRSIETLVPSEAILAAFNKITDPIMQGIIGSTDQSENLSSLRDSLLPKLLSGEIDLSDIQSEVA